MATANRVIREDFDQRHRPAGVADIVPIVPALLPVGSTGPRPRSARSIRSRLRLSIIDRYVAAALLPPFAAVVAIMVMLLTLENVPRLMARMVDVDRPLGVLGSYMIALLPEYVGIGLLVALYVAIALALRTMKLRGELDMFSASGLSNPAILRAPILIACIAAALVLAVRGYAEPWGERRIDALSEAIRNGDHGLRIEAGTIMRLGNGDAISVDRIDAAPNSFAGVFVQGGTTTFTAAHATASFGPDHRLQLVLERGNFARWSKGVRSGSGSFTTLKIALPLDVKAAPPMTPRESLDRLPADALLAMIRGDRHSLSPERAAAALGARIADAAFCLIIPFLAFALAIPPNRSRSALGLGLGIVLIVTFIKISASIEDGDPAASVALDAVLLVGWGVAAWLMMRVTTVHGTGTIEAVLMRAASGQIAVVRRLFA